MADLVLGFGSSHGPQLNMSPDNWPLMLEKDQKDPRINYETLLERDLPGIESELEPEVMARRYEECHTALESLRVSVEGADLDAIVIIGDDQHEQFHENNMPMFSIFYGDEIPVVARGRRDSALQAAWAGTSWQSRQSKLPQGSFPSEPQLARHIIASFIDQGIDISTCNSLANSTGAGHAFAFLYRYILPNGNVPVVPLMVNTFFKPNQPTANRCYEVGQALRQAIQEWLPGKRIGVMASGGLSHVIIDEQLDRAVLNAMEQKDQNTLRSLPQNKLELGTSEIRNWVTLAGAVEDLQMNLLDYVPCYRTPAGTGCAMGFATWD